MKKRYVIEYSQNSWEYIGVLTVDCYELNQVESRVLIADGIRIELDEEIGEIKELDLTE